MSLQIYTFGFWQN